MPSMTGVAIVEEVTRVCMCAVAMPTGRCM